MLSFKKTTCTIHALVSVAEFSTAQINLAMQMAEV